MVVTEVCVKLMAGNNQRLCAFCSVVFNGAFVVHDIKVVKGARGLFVAMPSRKITERCPSCGRKNHLQARFCNECGIRLDERHVPCDTNGQVKLHADVAHPINSECRNGIQGAILAAYYQELQRSEQSGHAAQYYYDDRDDLEEELTSTLP